MTISPFIIDGDTGRDDALAIWCSVALGLPLAGVVASFGNTSVDNVAENSARVLALAGRADIALCAGAAMPSRPHKGIESLVMPRQRTAGNGLCNVEFPPGLSRPDSLSPEMLAAWIVEVAEKNGGTLEYIITGPATNAAAVCGILGDRAGRYISGFTMMGGKLSPLWEEIPGADFNVACDPFAVSRLLEQTVPVRFVTMNTTWPVFLRLEDIERLRTRTAMGAAAYRLMIAYCRDFAPESVFRFHDPCVVMAMLKPERFRRTAVQVSCDEQSPEFGRLTEVKGGVPASLYEADALTRQLFLRQILDALGLEDGQ